MRTNSGNMRDNSPLSKSTVNSDNETTSGSFKRGGNLRSTAGARLQYDSNSKNNLANGGNFIKYYLTFIDLKCCLMI